MKLFASAIDEMPTWETAWTNRGLKTCKETIRTESSREYMALIENKYEQQGIELLVTVDWHLFIDSEES